MGWRGGSSCGKGSVGEQPSSEPGGFKVGRWREQLREGRPAAPVAVVRGCASGQAVAVAGQVGTDGYGITKRRWLQYAHKAAFYEKLSARPADARNI